LAASKNEYRHTTPGLAGYGQLLGFPVRPIDARGETVKNQGEIKSYKPDQEYYFK